MTGTCRNPAARRGAVLVESALTLTAFLMLVFAIIDFGQYLFLHHMLSERLRSAVRQGTTMDFNETAIQNLVLFNQTNPPQGSLPYLGLSRSMVVVNRWDAGSTEDRVQVSVLGYRFRLVTPFLSQYGFTGNLTFWLPTEKPH